MGFDSRDESREMRDESREIRDYKKEVLVNSLEADIATPLFSESVKGNEILNETSKKLSLREIEKKYPEASTEEIYRIFNNQ